MVDNRLLQRVPVYKSAPEDPVGPDDNALVAASPEPRLIDTILQVLTPKYESTRGQRNRSAIVNEVEDIFTRDRPDQPRFQLWPERMVRSAVTLPGDVISGNVPPPGLRREDYTDVPADPDKVGGQPHDDLIQRVQDLAGLAMTGGLAGTGQGGMVVGSGPVRSAPVPKTEKPASVWYSPVEHALEATTNARATGAQWLATLRNSRGVKPEELDWTGLRQYLEERADQSVSRPELHEYLRDNRVELQDIVRGGKNFKHLDEYALENYNMPYNALPENYQRIVEADVAKFGEGSTKYQSYQLPGGENYREHLITMPIRSDLEKLRGFAENRGVSNIAEAQRLYQEKYGELPRGSDNYKSSHWEEPNIVAHVRSNVREMPRDIPAADVERRAGLLAEKHRLEVEYHRAVDKLRKNDPAGRAQLQDKWARIQQLSEEAGPEPKPLRSLHLEEVQSDWHQAGRRKGYKDENSKAARDEAYNKWGDAYEKNPHSEETKQLRQLYEEAQQHHVDSAGGVPDAPWKKTWHELALRRMIRLAAEEGMDRISWTPGEAQAARYDLSKSIDTVEFRRSSKDAERGLLIAKGKNGSNVLDKKVSVSELPDVIGKEAADKLLKQEYNQTHASGTGHQRLENADLKVGGEGMRGFYDRMMVQAAEKVGREYGVKVKRGTIPGNTNVRGGEALNVPPREIYDMMPELQQKYPKIADFVDYYNKLNSEMRADLVAEARTKGGTPIWYFDIPPAMREAVLSKGMPLFSGGKMFVPSGAQRSESDGRD